MNMIKKYEIEHDKKHVLKSEGGIMPKTIRELAAELGVSKQRIQQIIAK